MLLIQFLKFIVIFIQIYSLFVISWYMPFSYNFFDSDISVSLNVFLLYIVLQSFTIERNKLIFIGFFIGLMTDLDLEGSSLGLNCFLFPLICFFLGFIKLNSNNWQLRFKIVYMFTIILFSNFIKSFFYEWTLIQNFLPIFINSLIILGVFLSYNYFLDKNFLK